MMIIHYQNAKGEEKHFRDVLHLQNINDDEWEVLFRNDRVITIRTSGIEAVYSEELEDKG